MARRRTNPDEHCNVELVDLQRAIKQAAEEDECSTTNMVYLALAQRYGAAKGWCENHRTPEAMRKQIRDLAPTVRALEEKFLKRCIYPQQVLPTSRHWTDRFKRLKG